MSSETLYDILTSIEKLGQVVDMDMETEEGKTPNLAKGIELELNDVSYSVNDREQPILSNINLTVKKGEIVLVRGGSGSGKSSMLRLLAGVNLPTQGSIFVNENNLKAIPKCDR